MTSIYTLIKDARSQVFRRIGLKRRSDVTGLFESSWQDMSRYVKKWGKISTQLDASRPYKFTFGNMKIQFENEDGYFNPHDQDGSFWYGYLNQQRTLVRIDAGFIERTHNGTYYKNIEYPSGATWNVGQWNDAQWDFANASAQFIGIVSGDILLNDNNDVTFNIKPLVSIFQDYPARNLTGWTSTGMTASQFVNMVRDQTDGSGSFVFRPFFEDTTSNWDISTTSNVYAQLNTSGAQQVINATVWEVMEKLAEAENFVPYVTRDGTFKFVSRDVNTTTSQFDFYGNGYFNTEYGLTIKNVSSLGWKPSKYYSRVEVKYKPENTTTSYEVYQSSFEVGPTNNPWILGHRTLKIENLFIATSTVAQTIAQNIFTDVSGLKREVEFTTSFCPQLDILDRFRVYYDPTEVNQDSFWDLMDWAHDSTNTANDLIFDPTRSESLLLQGAQFKFLSFEMDLDNFENRFLAREV